MSITLNDDPARQEPPSPDAPQATPDLAALRTALDAVDDSMHALLMRRAELVMQVAALKGGIAIRPGREAEIIRRLLARHQGPMPRATLVRVWRELLAGSNMMQHDHGAAFCVTVCDTDPASGVTQLAREHFGALTPLRIHRSPAQALGDIAAGHATIAVLPMPDEDEPPNAAWWTTLLHRDDSRIHVVARLPFWAPRPEGAPRLQALALAPIPPDRSSADRALIGLEVAGDLSRARLNAALEAAGLDPGQVILRRAPGSDASYALADIGPVSGDDDPRLAALGSVLRPPILLGAYALPAGLE